MKSLEERKRFRAKAKAKEENLQESPSNQKSDSELADNDGFDAKSWLDDSIDNIKKEVGTVSDEELDALINYESAPEGKNRAGATDALNAEKSKRAGKTAGWSNQ